MFQSALLVTQPPTALLYQLYLESGSMINVHDMWAAFNELIAKPEGGEEKESMWVV
jgi:origin recognition complex subunit 3